MKKFIGNSGFYYRFIIKEVVEITPIGIEKVKRLKLQKLIYGNWSDFIEFEITCPSNMYRRIKDLFEVLTVSDKSLEEIIKTQEKTIAKRNRLIRQLRAAGNK